MSEQSINGAPQGVTFDNEQAAPQPEAAAQPQAPTGGPQGVTFGEAKPIGKQPNGAPQGVTFGDEAKALPVPAENQNPYRALSQATSIGPRQGNWFKNWLEDVRSDVQNGTDTTMFGAALKRMGATGTNYPGASAMPNPLSGIPRMIESIPDAYDAMGISDSYEALRDAIKTGHLPSEEKIKEMNKRHYYAGARAINDMLGGVGETIGLTPLIVAPEAAPAMLSGIAAGHIAHKTAKALGADDETAELISNVAGIITGTKVHGAVEVSNFKDTANSAINADTNFRTRIRELDVARQQADHAQNQAIEIAQDEVSKVKQGNLSPEQVQELKVRTDTARTTASEAAANAEKAQKAFDVAKESKAEANLRLKKFSRSTQEKVVKQAQDEANRLKQSFTTNRETLQKAIPAKGTDIYSPDENGNYTKYDIIRSHLEAAKERGLPVDTIADARNAAEDQRQNIEDRLRPEIDKIKDEPLVDDPANSPKVRATEKLDQMAHADGNFAGADEYLSDFNVTDMTTGEAQEALTKLNDYMRSMKKSSNNWDIYNQIETNPKFAAYWFLADEIRDGLYDKLERSGVKNAAEARTETAALIDFRNAADAQLRRNAGQTTVRGSGKAGGIRNLVAKLTGKSVRGAGAAVGAKIGGPAGAVVGGAIGDMLGEPVQDFIAPGDLTRDEHVGKSMKTPGTFRRPVEIQGEAKPSVYPETPLPPTPKPVEGPQNIALTKRENTDLHADLAAHYKITDLDERGYHDLENDLKNDLEDKKKAGVAWTPEETKLWNRVLKANVADRGLIADANASATQKALTEEAQAKNEQTIAAALDNNPLTNETKNTLDVNPVLDSLGRGDESALVSHSVASKAHSPVKAISGLPEGLSQENAHIHEWSHIAQAAVDGLQPVDYISDTHPSAEKGSAAAARFIADDIRDANGNVDPEKFLKLETQVLSKKMAGPASHEVFDNLTYDEVKNLPSARADFRSARQLVREAHPDFTPAQVEAVIRAAYDRSRNFLSKPEVAKRVRANAAVREDNLPDRYHASAGRVSQFAADIRKAVEDENGTNDSGPNGNNAGQGGEKAETAKEKQQPVGRGAAKEEKNAGRDSGGSEGKSRRAASKSGDSGGGTGLTAEQQVVIPRERSTGDEAIDAAIKEGGAIPGGRQEGFKDHPGLAFFHDPKTGTTLALKPDAVTAEAVASKIKESRAQYEKAGQLQSEHQVKDVADAADEFNKENGREPINTKTNPHNVEFAKSVADAYDQMKHEPNNPKVAAAYDAMKNDVDKQWDYATGKMGIKFEPWTKEGQPYANSKEMVADVKNNKHLYFFQGGESPADNPLQQIDPKTGLSYNDKFRAVHDLFGHAAQGNEFGPKGEEVAYQLHRQMFSPEAVPALTTETRGQNSWVNFGKHMRDAEGNIPKKGEAGFIPATERPYAEQKTGLLPEEFHGEKPILKQESESNYDIAKNRPERVAEIKSRMDTNRRAGKNIWAGLTSEEKGIMSWDAQNGMDQVRDAINKGGAQFAGGPLEDGRWNIRDPKTGNYATVDAEITPEKVRKAIANIDPENQIRSSDGSWNPPTNRLQGPKNQVIDIAPEKDWAEKVHSNLAAEPAGGINPNNPEAPSKRYGLELLPEVRQMHDKLSPEAFREYAQRPEVKAALKAHPDVKLGWDTTGDTPELNVGITTDDLGKAKDVAKKLDQRAIWDNEAKDVIDSGGKGEKTSFPDYPLEDRLRDLTSEHQVKGSSVPLMEKPLKVEGTGEKGNISTMDVAQALNDYSQKQHPALTLSEENHAKMVARAKRIAEDEAKYQLAQGKTGTEWYTTEMKDHDQALREMRPEFEGGEPINAPTAWEHNPKLSLFKAIEAITSSGQKPYGNLKSALKAWDVYHETGEFPRVQPDGKSWGPRSIAAYGNAMDMLSTLVKQKGEKGAAEWLLSEHPVEELKQYNKDVKGKKTDQVPGAMILGAKRGPFMQNLHGIESAFTADMWMTRSWNRWMGTMEPGINSFTGDPEIQPNAPRNKTERDLMHKSFSQTADKLKLSTSSLQAVLWYYEQALYSKMGVPKESWSFRDAAQRVQKEQPGAEEQQSFSFGHNEGQNAKEQAGLAALVRSNPSKFVDLGKK